ncbi:cell wall-binding repeat-containing protein [Clostridium tetanomorphum]|uniref:cell wall-binding repeat-containing protein n=1 Tax=Clostridium tetanomorphum TaxID=1553 RepID=UPI000D995851|nr:cell wall-binding repeat-containing protein [Clostridium tetanomorphum]SQC01340.1 surface/cell-adhesion protein/N-acetylmuramoyl-L-alanine amidase [Clostridium tetanomorphum]
MNKRLISKIVAALFTVTSIAFTPSSNVEAKINKNRIYGKSRIETSVEISKQGWKDGSNVAVIAQGYNYADALSSAPLAKKYNAPILLTEQSKLSNSTINELKRLNVKDVLLVGGPKVVSENVEKQLKDIKINNVKRLYGDTRYETSLKIAEHIGKSNEVFITSGNGYADSLAVASIAAKKEPLYYLEKRIL